MAKLKLPNLVVTLRYMHILYYRIHSDSCDEILKENKIVVSAMSRRNNLVDLEL